jgi:hypothetical protein
MAVAVLLPCLLLFLTRLSIGSGYSFNIDTDVKGSSKTLYSSGQSTFGTGLDASQDFNGDGFNDILVCSLNTNTAYLFFGGVSGASTTPSVKFTGPTSSQLSSGCRYAGDVNKDGFADIIFGAPGVTGGGATYLVLGGPSTITPFTVADGNARTVTHTPGVTGSSFGYSTAGVGDVNKDTFDDFVICARLFDTTLTNVGACYVIYGGNNLQSMAMTNLGSGGIRIIGTTTNQILGQAVAGVGDINKDGYADILIGCGNKNNAYLLYGGPSLSNVNTTAGSFHGVIFPNPTGTFDGFGASVSGAGDFNGDGYDDLMIGSTSGVTNGQTYVVFGGSSLPASFNLNTMTSSTGVRYFTGNNDQGGVSVSGGVDFNRDGFDDIIIGASNAKGVRGAVHVVFGSASTMDSSVFHLGNGVISLNGTTPSSLFGITVAFENNVGTNSRGILVSTYSGVSSNPLYYFHDLLESVPSVSPSAPPTLSPTFPPSTEVPSVVPSESPTATPTMTPTVVPSVTPTLTPTISPSVVPSEGPAATPTMTPTVVPSVTPTLTPTRNPTAVPSESPTATPTMTPTVVPSVTPTLTPTRSPTVVPSESPTVTPTQTPTFVPSVNPTMTPSEVPTIVPSFRPSAPTFSPSAVPTPVPTGRSKSSIVINTGFTMNSVNGATLTPTSQETIKQSIADASQTTVNNVDLVSVTRTNRRLLLSSSSAAVVHRMLASVSLFSYKVVAEIYFNLIDFPGLNESYVAGTKSKVLIQSMESHEFDRIISYYAIINNASQLMGNANVSDVVITTSTIPAPDDSSSGSKEDLTVGEIVGIVVGAVAGTCLLTVLIYLAVVQRKSQSKARRIIPMVEPDYKSEKVPHSDNAVVDITKVYEDSPDKQFDHFQKLQMTTSSPDMKF